jgi:hypothetical protein
VADKPIQLVSGIQTEVEAKTSSAGAGDAGKIIALNGSGKLDDTMLPAGVGADSKALEASENLSAGDFINIHDVSGTPKMRKADASGGYAKRAMGYVLSAVTSGQTGTCYRDGTNSGRSGLTAGVAYYLSHSTPGGVVVAGSITTTAGHIVQKLGDASSATEISFEPTEPIVRA